MKTEKRIVIFPAGDGRERWIKTDKPLEACPPGAREFDPVFHWNKPPEQPETEAVTHQAPEKRKTARKPQKRKTARKKSR